MCSNNPRHQTGFTMIEVLVTVMVMAFGLLAFAFLQAQGMSFNQSAYTRTQATIAAYDIIDRMRANPQAALTGAYNATAAPTSYTDCDASGADCDTAELAAFDVGRWYEQLDRELGGTGTITWDGANTYTLDVQWTERETRDSDGDASTEDFLARSQLWEVQL
ncbi:MAG: type IV pilus modification protein PilV [Gammaproteobacteria bacterium]|nr:type IV pilus modification protein PilV [Gammaproteobacteria bacterium]